ncbi:hypothetical protein, partial [Streptomyces sp. HCCB10043]|uniref:hypothetical protein n=1 Tax=Streptomyces sp. HCCB10043 TaxID=1396518 RepID=UPI001F46385F
AGVGLEDGAQGAQQRAPSLEASDNRRPILGLLRSVLIVPAPLASEIAATSHRNVTSSRHLLRLAV